MRIMKNYFGLLASMYLILIVSNGSYVYAGQNKQVLVKDNRLTLVRDASLKNVQKAQEKNAGIDKRTLQEIEDATTSDRFTQTEAYFQVPELRKLVTEYFTDSFEVVRHMDIISRVMAKEAEFRNSHWAFYHGLTNVWNVWQDAYTKLYNHFNPSIQRKSEDFTFLRVGTQTAPTAKEFLIKELRENGLVDDNGEAQALLLSTNVSLFGNTAFQSESTWRYFMSAKEHVEPDRNLYETMLDQFDLPYTYVAELISLTKMLQSEQQTLLQIFVPKEIVDDVGYIAWATGMPYHEESVNWVRTNIKNKVYRGKEGKPGALWALADLKDKFKKQQEKNPLFREMIREAEQGDYSVNAFLKIYCNKPWDLPHLNYVQARLVLSNDVLLDPTSGVKMFRYTGVKKATMDEYENRLDEIIKKIVAEKITPATTS